MNKYFHKYDWIYYNLQMEEQEQEQESEQNIILYWTKYIHQYISKYIDNKKLTMCHASSTNIIKFTNNFIIYYKVIKDKDGIHILPKLYGKNLVEENIGIMDVSIDQLCIFISQTYFWIKENFPINTNADTDNTDTYCKIKNGKREINGEYEEYEEYEECFSDNVSLGSSTSSLSSVSSIDSMCDLDWDIIFAEEA